MVFGRERAEELGEHVGYCRRHKTQVIDNHCEYCEGEAKELDEELEDKWTCNECGELKVDDARVEGGMKCGECAYSGGEMVEAEEY